jgi:hypothetical protein
VGKKLGLFDTTTINAVLVVILASLIITPAMVSLFGKRVPSAAEDQSRFGKTVLVPVWGESSQPTVHLAGQLASSDGGIVVAASFANEEASPPELKSQRSLSAQAEQWLAKDGLESRRVFRIARTVPEGLLDTLLGENATLLVTEWRMRERIEPDSEASEALARTPVPILVVHGEVEVFERILIIVRREDLVRPGRQDVELAAQLCSRFAQNRRVGTVSAALEPVKALFATKQSEDRIEAPDPIDWLRNTLEKADLPFFAGLDAAREAVSRVPSLADGRFLVAIAAHETTFHKREERVAGPVVVGRSLKPHPA